MRETRGRGHLHELGRASASEQADAWTKSFDSGRFVRKTSEFRDSLSDDGSTPHTAEPGRFHLYISHACPWAQRTMLVRAMLLLQDSITVSVVDWRMRDDGSWVFNADEPGATVDHVNDFPGIQEVYLAAERAFTGIGTVPVLWDAHLGTIVNNESREIIRMMNLHHAALRGENEPSGPSPLLPPARIAEIDAMIDANYESVNNGVYKAGFARSQAAYEEAVNILFSRLDELEHLLQGRRYLLGDALTEADICLWPTLARFDLVYHTHFKCDRKRIIDMPSLWAYLRDIHQITGVSETCDWNHIRYHYKWSHTSINPFRIVSVGPDLDWSEPHGRESMGA